MNLYNLTGAYLYLLHNPDDMDEQTLADTLESIQESIYDKAANTAGLIKSIEADITTVDEEIKRLQKIKKQKQTRVHNIKQYLQAEMTKLNQTNIKTPLMNIRIQKNPPSVLVTDAEKIGKMYFVEQEPRLDKRSLLDDLKAGLQIPGAEIQQTESLRIN